MLELPAAVDRFTNVLQGAIGRHRGNRAYARIRQEAASVLVAFRKDPLNTDLVERCTTLVRRIESLNADELSRTTFLRSRSNVVYISALAKRTHYAAYMAGVWTSDPSVSKPFRVWMNNSAADGAINLYEAALPFLHGKGKKSDRRLLRIFAEGAISDAERFLALADRQLPECAVTQYNKAKVDIYHVERDRVRRGVANLKSIGCPSEDSEAPELIWHVDNYESFTSDTVMRERIQKEWPEALSQIKALLLKNKNEAKARIDQRGPKLWDDYHPYAKAILVGGATGVLLTLYTVLGDVSLSDFINVASAHADVVQAAASVHDSSVGGGGLAAVDFTRTMGFGGGGLA